jgi:hypothetical protein
MGDFNLPGINWDELRIEPGCRCRGVAESFLNLVSTHNLTQHVRGPTHIKGNTLDLILTRHLTPLHLDIVPGISDHQALSFSILLLPFSKKNQATTARKYLDLKNADDTKINVQIETLNKSLNQVWIKKVRLTKCGTNLSPASIPSYATTFL